jgi:hypothetical protein
MSGFVLKTGCDTILPQLQQWWKKGPNVLIANDDSVEVDAEAEPEKEEEVDPWEDDHGNGVSDVDSNHSEA